MATNRFKPIVHERNGFTLLELMVSVAILTIVIGVIVEGVNTMQARNTVETNKLDLTQESRQFMDQIVNDLHQSGFPRVETFDPEALALNALGKPDCALNNKVACGLISISQSAVQFEGDVDGTGVSEVFIQLVQTNGAGAAACGAPPCVIQRGTVSKASCAPLTATGACTGTAPLYFTEINNVMNTNVFGAYENDGTAVGLPITGNVYNSGFNITAIGITLYVKSSQPDPKTGTYPTVTMVSTAKINN